MCSQKHAFVLKKSVYKWNKLFKECRKSSQIENRLGRFTLLSAPEMVDLVANTLMLANRRVTTEDIFELLGISIE